MSTPDYMGKDSPPDPLFEPIDEAVRFEAHQRAIERKAKAERMGLTLEQLDRLEDEAEADWLSHGGY